MGCGCGKKKVALKKGVSPRNLNRPRSAPRPPAGKSAPSARNMGTQQPEDR